MEHPPVASFSTEGPRPADEVTGLREWSTGTTHGLPPEGFVGWHIGSAADCRLCLAGVSGVAPRHATLHRHGPRLILRAVGGGQISVDGEPRTEVIVEQGMEIGIGQMTLVAEGDRSAGLRAFLSRLLGWSHERGAIVDQALRSVRLTATGRETLVISGGGGLVPIAQSIHNRVKGSDRPFVVCDPRRTNGKESVRSAVSYKSATKALAVARDGTLCLRSYWLPADLGVVFKEMAKPDSRLQLIICSRSPAVLKCHRAQIEIPSLRVRANEVDRIIDEYAAEAFAALGVREAEFLEIDRERVRRYWSSSLPEIERATMRLIAVRSSRYLAHAAERLGMASVSLTRWLGRRLGPSGGQ